MNMVKFITYLIQLICIFADTVNSITGGIHTAVGILLVVNSTYVNLLSLA